MIVLGHLTNAFGLPIQGSVVFRLVNSGSTIPTNPGVGVIGTDDVTLQCDAGGLYSGSIIGNDVIDPPGTLYEVSFCDANGSVFQVALYSLVGPGNILLDTYPQAQTFPINSGSVPAANLTATNIWTGDNYFTTQPSLAPSPFSSSVILQVPRIVLSTFAPQKLFAQVSLGNGWGTLGFVQSISGTDQAFTVTVEATGTGFNQANAFISVGFGTIFADGDAGAPDPFGISKQTGGTGPVALTFDSVSKFAFTIFYLGIPVNGDSYTFTALVMAEA